MTTMRDIAAACQVSVSAVCTAINHPQKISKEVREKILNKARELNYFVKKSLKIQKVLLVFDNYKNHFYGEYYADVIFGITQRLSGLGIDCRMLSDFTADYAELYDYNGIIFVGKTPADFLARARQYRLPHVIAGHPNADYPAPVVYQDTASGLLPLLEYIKNCGHKRLAVLNGETNPKDIIGNEFLAAIAKIFTKKNITIYQADYAEVQSVEIAFVQMLKSRKATALLCSSDLLAFHAYRSARKHRVRIPKDISLAGLDNIVTPPFLEEPQPGLTTAGLDRAELGRQAVDLLLALLQTPQKVKLLNRLPMQIKIRNSVRRLG